MINSRKYFTADTMYQQMDRRTIQLCVLMICFDIAGMAEDDSEVICNKDTRYTSLRDSTSPSTATCPNARDSTESTQQSESNTASNLQTYKTPTAIRNKRRKNSAPLPKLKLKGSKNQRKKRKKKMRTLKSKRKGKQKR